MVLEERIERMMGGDRCGMYEWRTLRSPVWLVRMVVMDCSISAGDGGGDGAGDGAGAGT